MSADIAPHGADLIAAIPRMRVIPAPEPVDLTWHQADEITGRIRRGLRGLRDALDDVVTLAADVTTDVERAWAMRAGVTLGYGTWEAYVHDSFGTLGAIRLPVSERVQLVIALAATDLSGRGVSRVLGVAEQTVRADIRRARPRVPTPHAEPDTSAPNMPGTKVARVLAALDGAATAGLTAPETDTAHGWRHGTAGAIMSKLHARHRVARLAESRAGYAVYVALDHTGDQEVEGPGRRSRRRVPTT